MEKKGGTLKLINFIGWGFWGALAYVASFAILRSWEQDSAAFINATIIARVANSTVNFFVYKYFVYKKRYVSVGQVLLYIGLVLVLILLNTGGLLLWNTYIPHRTELWAQVFMIYPQALISRFYLKKWVFNWQTKLEQ